MSKRKLLNVNVNVIDNDDKTKVPKLLPRVSTENRAGTAIARTLIPKEPMLAYPLMSFDRVDKLLDSRGYGNFVVEPKYDGERTLCVTDGNGSVFFSRTLKRTNTSPFSVTLSGAATSAILDGERVYVRPDDARSDECVDKRVVPVCDTGNRKALEQVYVVFDVQAYNGDYVVYESLEERRRLLRAIVRESDSVKIVKSRPAESYDRLREIYAEVLGDGGEGLIVKDLRVPYTPGQRRDWIKLKPLHLREHRSEYDLYAHRAKRDKNGIFAILQCGYYETDGTFTRVCNVSSGLTDVARNRVKLLINPADGTFRQKTIVTVTADKITKTKKSLRHPAFLRFSFEKETVDSALFSMNKS